MSKSKPIPGHKCGGAVMSVHVNCECGWTSANWSGSGARKNAYAEWRSHVSMATDHKRTLKMPHRERREAFAALANPRWAADRDEDEAAILGHSTRDEAREARLDNTLGQQNPPRRRSR